MIITVKNIFKYSRILVWGKNAKVISISSLLDSLIGMKVSG